MVNEQSARREIGGYIELWQNTGPMLHEGASALNSAANCLVYILQAKAVQKIALPYYLCDSVANACRRCGAAVSFYHIGADLLPKDISLQVDEWLYIVNYYGQISTEQIAALRDRYERVIVDNVQAYYAQPVPGVDTLYSCRKFFGVPDGGFLYTDARLPGALPQDESYDRMRHLLGRYEKSASEFYPDYIANEERFESMPLRRMSRLTENLLRGIDYRQAKRKRTENFHLLHAALATRNKLQLTVPEGPFMYPLWIDNGAALRKELQKQKIYIPTLWPNVLADCAPDTLEYELAANILPLPVDQRYGKAEMDYLISQIAERMNGR